MRISESLFEEASDAVHHSFLMSFFLTCITLADMAKRYAGA
jgi:hypothetical protein